MENNYILDIDSSEEQFVFDMSNPKCIQVGQMYGTEREPNPQAGRIYDAKGISPTMDSCGGGNRMPKVLLTLEGEEPRIRKLTPAECFRLMGFEYTDAKTLKAEGISDTQLYKMAGNSIVVNVLEEIFKELKDIL